MSTAFLVKPSPIDCVYKGNLVAVLFHCQGNVYSLKKINSFFYLPSPILLLLQMCGWRKQGDL